MIEILAPSTDSCLVVHFGDKVTGREYQPFLDALRPRLKAGGPCNLVLQLSGFEFYEDWEAAGKDFKFGFGEYKHIHRAALVGAQKWVEWFVRWIGPFTRAEERHFAENQSKEAIEWAKG